MTYHLSFMKCALELAKELVGEKGPIVFHSNIKHHEESGKKSEYDEDEYVLCPKGEKVTLDDIISLFGKMESQKHDDRVTFWPEGFDSPSEGHYGLLWSE